MSIDNNNLINKRFGKLVVKNKSEDCISKNGRHYKQWLCKCDCGKTIILKEMVLKKSLSCGCEKTKKRVMSDNELKEWNNLYNYVKTNIMEYDNNQSLSAKMVLRLRGLANNKFIANNKVKSTANYSFDVILNTFKYCYPNIQKGLKGNSFKDENHKFAYVLKIVEGSLNTVYIKMRNAEKAKEGIENVDINISVYNGAEYKKKKNRNDKFSDLW